MKNFCLISFNHLLTLKLFQTCVNFFLLLNTNKDIFKLVINQLMGHIGHIHQLFGYPYYSKYLLLCSAEERNEYMFGTT